MRDRCSVWNTEIITKGAIWCHLTWTLCLVTWQGKESEQSWSFLLFLLMLVGFCRLTTVRLYGETGATCSYRAFLHHYWASLCVDCVQALIVMCCIIGTDPCCSAGLGSHSPTGSRSGIRQLYLSAALCWRYLRAAMLCVSHRAQLLISRLIRKV